jgi:HD-GYP domain-containing protein (c-di-GMP phosphodiesterase class II)
MTSDFIEERRMGKECVKVLTGPLQGQEFLISPTLSIGRNPGNGIVLDDAQVSRKHAVIESTESGTTLKDLGSGNGTFVDNRRILEYRLTDGQEFRVGSVELKYEGEPGSAADATSLGSGSRVKFDDTSTGTVQASSTQNVFQTMFSPAPQAANTDELRATQKRLAAIYEANQIISSENDLGKLFAHVLDQIFKLVPANNGVIMMANEETGELEARFEKTGVGEAEIRVSSTIVQRAFENGENLLVQDAVADDRFDASASIMTANISSAMAVPLVQQGEKLGVLYVDTRGSTDAFKHSDLELIVALSGPASIAIKNAQYVDQLETDFQTTLRLLANAIELRDHYTVGHTWRVTNFSVALAGELGYDEEKLKEVEMGGVLHDIGKIGVPDAILCKPGKLTDDEYEVMKVHPTKGADLMEDCKRLEPLIPYCKYHHERYDGRGYPEKLAGEEIPIQGRIVAVADTFDAMTSNRPYRKGLDPEIAIAEIEKNKGSQFDPECADAFIRAYRGGKISHILQAYHENEKSIACPFCSTFIPIEEGAELGNAFECNVCHRHSRLDKHNENYIGVLLTEADMAAAKEA